jgi:hypothetical protein
LAAPRNRRSALLAFLRGERETVMTLFADIKGSTELMRDLDPEEARAIVDPALKPMIDVALLPNGVSFRFNDRNNECNNEIIFVAMIRTCGPWRARIKRDTLCGCFEGSGQKSHRI